MTALQPAQTREIIQLPTVKTIHKWYSSKYAWFARNKLISGGHILKRCGSSSVRILCTMYSAIAVLAMFAFYKIKERFQVLLSKPESGAATAEYAIVLIAATAFAGVLLAVLKSGTARDLLLGVVKRALSVA